MIDHCAYAALSQDTLPYDSDHPTHEIINKHEPTPAQVLPFHATQPCTSVANGKDYLPLHPIFGWLPMDTIKCTFEATAHYACIPMSTILKKHFNAALNVQCHNEPLATDTLYSDTSAIG